MLQVAGPDGKPVKVPAKQQVVVDAAGQPVLGADAKIIFVPLSSAIAVPYADGRFSLSGWFLWALIYNSCLLGFSIKVSR